MPHQSQRAPTPPASRPVRPAAGGGYPPPGYRMPPPAPRPVPRRPRKRFRLFSGGCLITMAAALGVFAALVLVLVLIVIGALSARLEDRLAEMGDLSQRQSFQTTMLFDRNGEELYQIFDEGRRTNIRLGALPEYVKWATIAVEDDSFYRNPGIDLPSILRSFAINTQEGTIVTGASTITQQLVRNIAFDYEYRTAPSWQRKIEEALLAMILTNRMSKDEILELYLNEVYYGNLAYGIEAASQTILGKPAAELTLGEAALLAGLPQVPAELDPLNPDPQVQQAVLDRRRLVIDLMLEEGYVSQEEAYAAYGEPLSYASPDVPLVAPHFTVEARSELEALMATLGYPPELIASGGLTVYTTVDLRFQDMATRIAREQVAGLRDAHNMTNGAVVVLHPYTGEVLAMVGSIDYWDDAIDGRVNVTRAPRQPGSTMKPFTYAAALELGWTPANIIWDTELRLESAGQPAYVPVNYDSAFHGPVRVRDALANSYNIPAVQTLRQIGVPYLLNFMERFGVDSLGNDPSYYGLSLTLGGGEVTLLELTRGYSVFANGGLFVPSTMIRCVLDGDDNILYQYENGCPVGQNTPATVNVMAYGLPVLDPRIAFLISDILADNDARTPAMGARSPLYTGELVASVKTGTTNDTRDNWTVGYNHNVAVGVWAGNSDNSAMINTSGLTGAAPIWNAIMTGIYADQDLLAVLAQNGQLIPDYLTAPSGMTRQEVCEIGTLRDPATDCPATRTEWFMDSPALVPDGQGNLVPGTPVLAAPLVTPDPDANGPQLNEPERGLFQAIVKSLPPDVAQAVQAAQRTPSLPDPPLPRYCLVPNEIDLALVSGAQGLLFIGGPQDPQDAIYAARWADTHNVPILPTLPCTGEMLLAGSGPVVVEAFISAPAPGDVVNSVIPIMGTANFSQQQAEYYKLELRGPAFPDWVTIGEPHAGAVINGQLETLAAAGLTPGTYYLRLIIVGLDGNYLQEPYQVSFTVQ
ncbi:MAG: transglycosylase domain-containing protein [Anaerolineae bacterium]|nr:transglycosylase domain-containing protein [Anaerolineae bacterium]